MMQIYGTRLEKKFGSEAGGVGHTSQDLRASGSRRLLKALHVPEDSGGFVGGHVEDASNTHAHAHTRTRTPSTSETANIFLFPRLPRGPKDFPNSEVFRLFPCIP